MPETTTSHPVRRHEPMTFQQARTKLIAAGVAESVFSDVGDRLRDLTLRESMEVVSEERDVSIPEAAQVADNPARRRRARVVPLVALALSMFAGLSESAGAESKSDRAILKAGVITKAD